ncbi:type IX secretion system membrane protein PorP/SprF [Seonamhaeicola maritimus]|uniref:Type IX secretion system membrane protein PorP/SprF n=2 Tax=Seonamhaeicola maritimus TaxID=2591822 RepID=A0A5C7GE73_9FLAO|nr:type IX secretion system membrane protein PorP/SprF [Seonamhaeicola maritimus]
MNLGLVQFKVGCILIINTKKMKQIINKIIVMLVLCVVNTINAQQDPAFTLYNYNMNIVNPAFAGIEDLTEVNLNFRSQWVNLEGSPETKSLIVSTPINDRIGLGLSIMNDNIFVLNQTDIYADFSYRIPISDHTNFYMGIKAGGTFIDVDLDRLGIMNDPVFMENVNQFNPNVGIGFLLKSQKYYVTASSPTLLKSKRYDKDGIVVTDATDELHAYFGGGLFLNLSEQVILKPSVMSRYVTGAPMSVDLTAVIDFSVLELGVSHRLDESVSAIVLLKLAEWGHFGYAYESTTTDVKNYSRGSHEVLLKFRF